MPSRERDGCQGNSKGHKMFSWRKSTKEFLQLGPRLNLEWSRLMHDQGYKWGTISPSDNRTHPDFVLKSLNAKVCFVHTVPKK